MNIDIKLNRYQILKFLYGFYDEFMTGIKTACNKGCSTCCTVNVTATSLEADYMLEMAGRDKSSLFEDNNLLDKAVQEPHYQPTLTTNKTAIFCLKQKELPEEPSFHSTGSCPFLNEKNACSVYDYRPFSCRAMSSETVCKEDGQADMPPFVFTVNLAFYQLIEHLDKEGLYGNMLDLIFFNSSEERSKEPSRFVKNSPLPAFLVPPDERIRFRSLLRRLTELKLPNGDVMGKFFPENLI